VEHFCSAKKRHRDFVSVLSHLERQCAVQLSASLPHSLFFANSIEYVYSLYTILLLSWRIEGIHISFLKEGFIFSSFSFLLFSLPISYFLLNTSWCWSEADDRWSPNTFRGSFFFILPFYLYFVGGEVILGKCRDSARFMAPPIDFFCSCLRFKNHYSMEEQTNPLIYLYF